MWTFFFLLFVCILCLNLASPALEAGSRNHWTAGEVSQSVDFECWRMARGWWKQWFFHWGRHGWVGAYFYLSSFEHFELYVLLPMCSQSYSFFSVVMYECESWTIEKAEYQRIDAFELWCWRRLLWVPWTARRSNQSILKEISPEYSLEGLMLQLKLQYFGHLMWRADSLEKTLMLGKTEGRRRRGQQRMRWLDGCDSWGRKESDTTERLNWTELNWIEHNLIV